MEASFRSALRRLPVDIAKALEQAGLDDASTLANYPRAPLGELRSRGFGVEPVGETRCSASDLDTDVVMCRAATYDVSTGGGTTVVCSLPVSDHFLFPLRLVLIHVSSPALLLAPLLFSVMRYVCW